ncbi:hypothetical protein GCM10010423_25550 [Streptomyces levis]|uniref:Zinc-finger domain-containing protein n=1 Tax=Streptomyces levis TaxID=285566 RepID=A0ABN3NP73_9ACTN
MTHVDPSHLVELALGNATRTAADTEALHHIAHCTRCRDDLHTMTRVVEAARTAELIDLPTAPPERVWHRITRDLSAEPTAPQRPRRTPDRRKRTLLALLALATAAAIAAARCSRCRRAQQQAAPHRLGGPGCS